MAATLTVNATEPLKASTTSAVSFESFELPSTNQRLLGAPHPEGTVSPLALRPSTYNDAQPALSTIVDTIKNLQAQDGILTKKLAVHGSLLFRGLPITSAADFSTFAHAFGYRPHEIIGIVVDRPVLAPNVAPANEAPPEVLIYNHNESPQVPHAPSYIFFYAHKADQQRGGETPISSSLELFHRAQQELPEFVAALKQKGILSRVTYKFDRQYAGGSTLRQAFGKLIEDSDDAATRRRKIEAQIRRYGRGEHTTWEWAADGSGVVVTHRLPVIRTQPATGLPTLFTSLAAFYKNNTVNSAARKNVTQQLFGDGTPIPEQYLQRLAEITDEIRVLHKWQRSDVLVFDNVVAQHGREPWVGEQADRVVMASLFDGEEVPGAYGEEEWAQVVRALDDDEVAL